MSRALIRPGGAGMGPIFQDLPRDLIFKVLDHLSLTKRFGLASVCRAWHRFCLNGLMSIDIRKTLTSQGSQNFVRCLELLMLHNTSTLRSLTVHLQHCECSCGGWNQCGRCNYLKAIAVLPRKHPLSVVIDDCNFCQGPHVFEFLSGTITSSLPQFLPVAVLIFCHQGG